MMLGRVAVAVLLAAAMTGGLAAQEPSLRFRAVNEDHTFWFTVDGAEGRNPALAFAPGEEVEVSVRNDGSTIHNLHFGTGDRSRLLQPGESDAFTVRVDANATQQDLMYYWCDPHRDLGMIGSVTIADEAQKVAREEEEGTGALGAAAVGVSVLLLLVRRR